MSGLDRSRAATRARHADWYGLYVKDGQSTHQIAQLFNLDNHTTVYNGILSHARRIGRPVARLEDLRSHTGNTDRMDWSKLGEALASWRGAQKLSESEAAEMAGFSRSAYRNAEQGRKLEGVTLLAVCAAASLDPFDFFQTDFEKDAHDA